MKQLLEEWELNSKANKELNFLFIRSLKERDMSLVDALSKEIHKETFDEVDCLQCANCCKTSKPNLYEDDIQNISNHLSRPVQNIKIDYLELDEYDNWTFNSLPCPFLSANNSCKIYEARPKDCREFPHTNKSSFSSRSHLTSHNTTICPAAYKIVERMKKRIEK